MVLAGVACFVEDLMGFVRGKALIPEVNGQAGQLAKLGGEGLSFDGLGAEFAGEMHGVADNNGHDSKAPGKTGDGAQILAWVAVALERENRLGGEAEFVRDSNANAAIANIEGEVAGRQGRGQIFAH